MKLVIGIFCLAVVGGAMGLSGGCASDQALTVEQAQAEASQKFDYDYVKQQSRQLLRGMSKAEVLILLGSPAQREAARWIYWPKDRPGVFVPAEAMVVRFVRGRYDSHSFEPIIFGERFGS